MNFGGFLEFGEYVMLYSFCCILVVFPKCSFIAKGDVCLLMPVCRLNEIACQQLDHLQETYPIISAPTQQVISSL